MRLNRLRQLTAAEVRWRAAERAHTLRERVSASIRPPRWDRRDLLRALSKDAVDDRLEAALHGARWDDAHTILRDGLARRPSRYVLDPASRADIRHAVLGHWPEAAGDARRIADRILEGRYDLLGYHDLAFRDRNGRVDWHADPVHGRRAPRVFWARVPYLDPSIGDHKIIWEINRHQHWLRLGRAYWLTSDERYARAILTELNGWLDANPPLVGVNWSSMLELAFRSLSWTWVVHALAGSNSSGPWLLDMLLGLDRQLSHVERHLSHYFSPNTHLTGEALALYVAGTAFPELARSARWAETGRRILIGEIDRQVLPDGGHVERSTHYQRYTLDFYLLARATAGMAGDREAHRAFDEAVRRLAAFTRAIADDHGRLPLIGDDDGGMLWPLTGRACHDVRDSLALAAAVLDEPGLAPWGVTEEAIWTGGPAISGRLKAAPTSSVSPAGRLQAAPSSPGLVGAAFRRPDVVFFPDTGYAVLRDGRGGHAVFDVGRHGYLNAGHAHADALALTLTVDGRPFLIDPGTGTYTVDPALRDRLRHSASHNTLTLDGRSQSEPAGPFHWRTRTDARVEFCREHAGTLCIEAAHDAYAPATHRRTVMQAPGNGWLVEDTVLDRGALRAAVLHWHFDPAWTVAQEDEGLLRAVHRDGAVVWLRHDGESTSLHYGDAERGLGWQAPVYGQIVRTWTARVTRRGSPPFSIATWILARTRPDGDRLAELRAHMAQVRTGPGLAPLTNRNVMRPDVCA